MASTFRGLLGEKLGMTQVFDENNRIVPVTVVKAGPCVVTQVRTPEVDGYSAWLPGPTSRPTHPLEVHLGIAEALGARSLNVIEAAGSVVGTDVSIDEAAAAFADVCDRAGELGLLVTLEYYPWSGVPDSATALAVVRAAGRANGDVLLDTWHHVRGPDAGRLDLEELAPHVLGVQVSDAAPERGPDVRRRGARLAQ